MRTRPRTSCPTLLLCSCSRLTSWHICKLEDARESKYAQFLTKAYRLLTELEEASDSKYVLWGTLLLLVNLGTVVLAIVLQIAEKRRDSVVQLMLLERESRVGRARNFHSTLRKVIWAFFFLAGS